MAITNQQSSTFDEEEKKLIGELSGIFPQGRNAVDVTDSTRTFPTADVSKFPKRLSPTDILTLMSYTDDPRAVGRLNAWRSLAGRSGTYRRSAPTGLQAALNSIAGTTDDEIQAAALKTLREAINSGELPLGNMEAFNQWAVSLPHHFIKDVRNAYQSMSTQVHQERTREIADLKLPYELGALEFAESLQPGRQRIQELEIGQKEHTASMFDLDKSLKILQQEKSKLDKTLKDQQVATGEYTESTRLDAKMQKLKNEQEVLLNDQRLRDHPDTKPVYDENGVPYYYGWNHKTEKYEPLKDKDGNKLQASIPPDDTTKQRDFRFYIDQVNEARKIEGKEPLTDREEADIFNKYFLKEQIETREAYTPSMVSDLGTKKVAFLNSRDLSLNMLKLLGKSDTLVGGIQSFFGGLNNIAGQWRQAADMFGESDLANNKKLYTWDAPEMGDVLQSNLMALAYSLARSFEDEGGRLSKEDVQHQLDILMAGRQSKSRMAAVLFETHNRSLARLKNQYLTSKDAQTPGTERSWKDYQAFIRTGPLLTRTRGNETGVGYWVDVIGPDGKTVIGEDGKEKREFIVFAKWPAGS